ncbi:MAG: MazG nucleotide pyrophosphohydrolase domain-containing protein [Vulcanimicrobiota bacterium]
MFADGADLPTLQAYMAEVCRARGWDQADDLETFLLFSEEVGELAKAIRNERGLFAESARPANSGLAEEMADVLSYLLDLANRFGVDLEAALRAKEEANQARHWS